MIGFLEGALAGLLPGGCFVDVGGVGYRVACSTTTLAALPPEGERCRLWTHVYVREDALALFGFFTESEQRMFEALIGVSGVGPKVALQVCSAFTPEKLRQSLMADDVDAIAAVPGIGKKTAQRILVDLKEKLGVPELADAKSASDTLVKARSALENLGYSPGEARAALGEVSPEDDADVEDVVRSALKVLA